MKSTLAKSDLSHIWQYAHHCLDELNGTRLFITGGTGFFGCWLLESLRFAKTQLGLSIDVTVLTRNPDAFQRKTPHLADLPGLTLLKGDVTHFAPPDGEFTHLIHAATDAQGLYQMHPLTTLNTIVDGTRHTLEFAVKARIKKYLLISSGAVYGIQPATMSHLDETYLGAPDPLNANASYGLGKRMAEHLGVIFAREFDISVKIARCFAFVGPYMPLDAHFAIGNFIKDIQSNKGIQILGDGSPYRSYLYAADLVIWLWTILCQGESGLAYNVGSEEAINLYDLAHLMTDIAQTGCEVSVAKSRSLTELPARYVPNTLLAQTRLRLKQRVTLEDAIKRTLAWSASS